jgi:membrane-bound ClpP family serine protease
MIERVSCRDAPRCERPAMLILGVILLVLGWALGIGLLTTLGIILAVIGAVLLVLGGMGHPVGGRTWY